MERHSKNKFQVKNAFFILFEKLFYFHVIINPTNSTCLFLIATGVLHRRSAQTSSIRYLNFQINTAPTRAATWCLHSVWERDDMIKQHLFLLFTDHLNSNQVGLHLSPLTLSTVEHSARPRAFSAVMVYSPMSLGPTRRINMEQTPQVLEM